jgi:hypothetical protein
MTILRITRQHNGTRFRLLFFAECRVSFTVMLSVVKLSVVMLNVGAPIDKPLKNFFHHSQRGEGRLAMRVILFLQVSLMQLRQHRERELKPVRWACPGNTNSRDTFSTLELLSKLACFA